MNQNRPILRLQTPATPPEPAAANDHDSWPTDAELKDAGYVPISRRKRIIDSTPRIGQVFWVDFPHDACTPEFVREHPCVVVRAAQTLDHTCSVVPISSTPQAISKHVHKLAKNPNPKGDRADVYAVCDHVYTINVCRLRPFKNRTGTPVYPKVDQGDLLAIFAAIRAAFIHVFQAADPPGALVPKAPEPAPVGNKVARAAPVVEEKGSKPQPAAVNHLPKANVDSTPPTRVGPSGRKVLTLAPRKE